MKVSSLKFIKQLVKKKVFFYPQKYLSKKIFFIGSFLILLLTIFSYFLKPLYFDYNENKDIIQKKINEKFSLTTLIDGNISYSAYPAPTIKIENVRINFGKPKSREIKVKKILIRTATNKLNKINQLDFKKLIFDKQIIEINSSNLKHIFNFFTLHKKGQILFKSTKVVFEDDQKNKVNFEDINLQDKFSEDNHKIDTKLFFSNNEIKIKFRNNLNAKKFLNINIPDLNQSLEINFDKESNLNNLIGNLKLSIFDSILLINFKGKDDFKISNSYLRNKFINTKIDGKISFKDPFYFDLKLGINQISLRKLLAFYPILETGIISKKINGVLNIDIKNIDSLLGKTKNANMQLHFQNGDLKLKNIKFKLPFTSILNSNVNLYLKNNKPKIEYDLKFSSNNAEKFLRKLGIYDYGKKKINIYSEGVIDINNKKIKFIKLLKDQVQIKNKNQIKLVEEAFNKNILNENISDLFDLFKFKKFLKEVY